MAEYNINPLLNIHKGGKYKNMIYINSYQFDSDATKFIDALNADPAGTLTSNQEQYIRTLVSAYKSNGLWDKRIAIYPMIGGTKFKHGFNLKDPRNLDAAYRLVFPGIDSNFTHDSNGVKTNTTTYATTNVPLNFNGTLFNISMGFYSFTNISSGGGYVFDMGARPTSGSNANQGLLIIKLPSGSPDPNTSVVSFGGTQDAVGTNVVPDTRGWFLGSRTASNSIKMYRNDAILASNTNTEVNNSPGTPSIILFALWDGTAPGFYSTRGCSFSVIGDGLDDTDQATEFSIIQNFQTSLGRNFS